MAKQTALKLVNTIMARIGQSQVTDVSDLTEGSHADIAFNLYNEAQNLIYAEDVEWYSLYKTRQFSTVNYTAATITFNNANPDTLTDSANGFGSFESGMQILVSGSSSNDGAYTVDTAAAGTLTLQSADNLTAEAAGESVTILAVTYPVPTDWARTISMLDTTNDTKLKEVDQIDIDEIDSDMSETGTPSHYALNGDYYRFYRIPTATLKMRERYYRLPTAFSANTDTSILPIETENCMIWFVWAQMLDYASKFDEADRKLINYRNMLNIAKKANKKKLNKMRDFVGAPSDRGIRGPSLPSSYGTNSRCI